MSAHSQDQGANAPNPQLLYPQFALGMLNEPRGNQAPTVAKHNANSAGFGMLIPQELSGNDLLAYPSYGSAPQNMPSTNHDVPYLSNQSYHNTGVMSTAEMPETNPDEGAEHSVQPINEDVEDDNTSIDPALLNLPLPGQAVSNIYAAPAMSHDAHTHGAHLHHVPLTVHGVKFGLDEQKFVIQAMSYYGYDAEDVAPCFGLLDDGSGDPEKTIESVQAVHELLKGGRSHPGNSDLWVRDDATFKYNVKYRIREAREKRNKILLPKMEREEEEMLKKTRANMAMFDEWVQEKEMPAPVW